MKFAHLADCHIGSWKEPHLSELNTKVFEKAVDKCIQEDVDFILIAGDLFNTSLPGIDKLKIAVKKLKQLSEKEIPVYIIAGSHDFSPSGKTMLDVLENAGLVINVSRGETVDDKLELKFTIDKKTGAKITGLLGRAGSLDKNYYENLNRDNLEKEEGYKIFLFHTLLTEYKPKDMEKVDSLPLSLLPKSFDYYAGGHPHFVFSEKIENYGVISYPGPLFPNSFKELEELHQGGFYLIEDKTVEWIPIKLHDVENININCNHSTPDKIESEIKAIIEKTNFRDKIITIRLSGILESGRPSEISIREIFTLLREKGAFAILKNSSALSSKEFEDIKIMFSNKEEIEENLIKEHINEKDLDDFDAVELSKTLMNTLDSSKQEGEKVYEFEKRLIEEVDKLINS